MPLQIRRTRIGTIAIAEEGGRLCSLRFLPGSREEQRAFGGSSLLDEAFAQLDAWLAGRLPAFSLPLAEAPTPFAAEVRRALLSIPRGERRTYGQLARALGRPSAARAVGNACARNPLPLIVPCHRVVPLDGTTGNYLGGAPLKALLLRLEEESPQNSVEKVR